MNTRLRTVMAAVAIGLLATLGTALYINSVKAGIVEAGAKMPVYVATGSISAGSPVAALEEKGLVAKVDMPKRYVAEDGVVSLAAYKDELVASPLSKGEQLTKTKLRSARQSEAAHKLAGGKIALAIPVDDVVGVGGEIQTGDKVVILATFSPGPGGADITKVLMGDVEVVSTGGAARRPASGPSPVKRTLTVAVTPAQAEKLVFAEEKGKVWVGLSGTPSEVPATAGQTMESVFK